MRLTPEHLDQFLRLRDRAGEHELAAKQADPALATTLAILTVAKRIEALTYALVYSTPEDG